MKPLPEEIFLLDVRVELDKARECYGWWPENPVEAVAIFNEESGEVVKAMNNYYHGHGDDTPESIYEEFVQTVAMAMRAVTETSVFQQMWENRT